MDILLEEMDGSLWVAAVENGRLQGLDVDPDDEDVRWGSIYYGRVDRIDASLDAAFIDLDGENFGILYNADLLIQQENGPLQKGGRDAIGKRLKPGQMIVVQAKSARLVRADDSYLPLEDKIAKVSTEITIQGRHLIYAPMMETNRLSMRIRDKKLRRRMTKMLNTIESIRGFILRASAANTQTDILVREGKILRTIWEQIQKFFTGDTAQLIMLGPDAMQRALSDNADKRIEHIEIVTMEQFQDVEEWCEIYAPDLVTKIVPVELSNAHQALALFDYRDIMDQVDTLLHPYILLASGASVIIQETVALTAVDINRGAHTGSNLDINLETASEVARQLKLRNIGGIVVIDFLKMKTKKERDVLMAALENIFDNDPCTVQLHGMTALGLVEVTRKRRTPPLREQIESAVSGI